VTRHASVENNFEDSDAVKAEEYQNMLHENDWDDVRWIHIPGMTYEQYIKEYMKRMNGVFE